MIELMKKKKRLQNLPKGDPLKQEIKLITTEIFSFLKIFLKKDFKFKKRLELTF